MLTTLRKINKILSSTFIYRSFDQITILTHVLMNNCYNCLFTGLYSLFFCLSLRLGLCMCSAILFQYPSNQFNVYVVIQRTKRSKFLILIRLQVSIKLKSKIFFIDLRYVYILHKKIENLKNILQIKYIHSQVFHIFFTKTSNCRQSGSGYRCRLYASRSKCLCNCSR